MYTVYSTKITDDGQKTWPKHVEFYSKNKFEKLVHLVGFIIRIYHDARPSECQKCPIMSYRLCQTSFTTVVHLQNSWAKLHLLCSDRRRYTADRNVVLTQILRPKCYDVFSIRPKHPQIAASDLACSEIKHALIVKLLKWYNLVHAF